MVLQTLGILINIILFTVRSKKSKGTYKAMKLWLKESMQKLQEYEGQRRGKHQIYPKAPIATYRIVAFFFSSLGFAIQIFHFFNALPLMKDSASYDSIQSALEATLGPGEFVIVFGMSMTCYILSSFFLIYYNFKSSAQDKSR